MKKTVFFAYFLIFALLLAVPAQAAEAEAAESLPEETAETTEVLPEDPGILAKAALLVDLNDNGKLLYGKNEHQELYPASLTKIMTCLLVLEAVEEGRLSLDTEITASDIVWTLPRDSSSANILPGEIMSVRNLLYCLMVVSANESAEVLAEAVSGTVERFVTAMNQKAISLGCEHTHFVNTNGLHDEDHYTSAWDMALITREAMKYPAFMTLCDTDRIVLPATNLSGERTQFSTNHLISNWRLRGYKNEEVHGVKTGSTSQAGYCLVSTAQRGREHYLSVIMGADRVTENNGTVNYRSFSETTRLFNWGFDNFGYATILEEGEPIQEVPVSLSRVDHVVAVASRSIETLMPVKLEASMLERVAHLEEETVEAPVEEGQRLGTLELRYQGVVYGTADLLASHSVERSRMMAAQKRASEIVHSPAVWIGAAVIAAGAAAFFARSLIFGRRRYRYGKAVSGRRDGYRGGRRRSGR